MMVESNLPRKIHDGFHKAIEDYIEDHLLWCPVIEWRTNRSTMTVEAIVHLKDGRSRRVSIEKVDGGVAVQAEDTRRIMR